MSHSRPLPVSALLRSCPPASLGFRTTAELPDVDTIVGQDRAMEAIDLAVGMAGPGFNVFALGPSGIGKMTALRRALTRQAARDPIPDDWCYVHDFEDPQRPRALRLPAGRAVALRAAMVQLCAEVQVALVAAFESDTYRARRAAMEAEAEARRDAVLAALEARGRLAGVAVVRTPVGMAVAPLQDGRPLEPDAFHALPEDEQQRLRGEMERLGDEVQEVLRQVPVWTRELDRRIRELDRDVTTRRRPPSHRRAARALQRPAGRRGLPRRGRRRTWSSGRRSCSPSRPRRRRRGERRPRWTLADRGAVGGQRRPAAGPVPTLSRQRPGGP